MPSGMEMDACGTRLGGTRVSPLCQPASGTCCLGFREPASAGSAICTALVTCTQAARKEVFQVL